MTYGWPTSPVLSQDGLTVLDAAVKAKMGESTCFKNPETIPAQYRFIHPFIGGSHRGFLGHMKKKGQMKLSTVPSRSLFRGWLVAPGLQGGEKGRGGECCLRLLCWWWSRGSEGRFVWRWQIRWIPPQKWWKESGNGTHPKCPKQFRFWELTHNLGRQWWNLKMDWNNFAREKRAPGRLG